jgi:hypothetical protein
VTLGFGGGAGEEKGAKEGHGGGGGGGVVAKPCGALGITPDATVHCVSPITGGSAARSRRGSLLGRSRRDVAVQWGGDARSPASSLRESRIVARPLSTRRAFL